MAKQIETSFETFAQPESAIVWIVLPLVAVVCLAVGIVLAITAGNWLLLALLLISLVVVALFSVKSILQSRKTEKKRFDWETAMPEIQRQNLNIEVLELSKILKVEPSQISDLQSAYIVAEDLALRQIQQEENVPLIRHVMLGKAPFEAVLIKNDVINCIEVAFLVAPDMRQERVDAMMRKIALVKKTFGEMRIRMKVRLMLVLVTQLTPEGEDQLRSMLNSKRFAETPVDIDIRLLDFESLQRIYVTD
ncbi:MAG: hypothetical protein WBD27_11380 [Pyrinomonadaceae bacterium]